MLQQNHIQVQHQQLLNRPNTTNTNTTTHSEFRVHKPYQVRGECFYWHKKGHSYNLCRNANENDKLVIRERLTKAWNEKNADQNVTVNHLNSKVASSTSERRM